MRSGRTMTMAVEVRDAHPKLRGSPLLVFVSKGSRATFSYFNSDSTYRIFYTFVAQGKIEMYLYAASINDCSL